jgi:hypothetical protein
MWLFGRKAKAQALPVADALQGKAVEPQVFEGPHLIRRTEITVEREWTSTVTRTGEQTTPAEIVIDGAKRGERG